ncbi:Vibriobactin utilization protein ViuB [Ephemeroptericola cinctiostellae]|uniref:Vibriobactin utilization protein ViuB n=1 Tax=Ephemeroptericola cinctiostellae TaxID=2268024 RepID=A0A345DB63_9BURK|nr:siderophore-interacting protein [Ephemeroptericola cinctiostellae]AXF85601.1 Vibriobactin utilization protein ViuB [Ephemeroptericola cinctiostellae]
MSKVKKTPPRLLRVVKTQDLSPYLRRVVLTGESLSNFPVSSLGAHIKLMLPQSHQISPVLPTLDGGKVVWPEPHLKPILRTYTVADFDPVLNLLSVDFVMHGDNGPASRWAHSAVVGSSIGVAGPGGPDLFQAQADWFVLAGDLSALPVIRAVLSQLPKNARGYAFIEVADLSAHQPLPHPMGMHISWLNRKSQPAGQSQLLLQAVKNMSWLEGVASATIAGESSQVVLIRDYLRIDKQLSRDMMYAVPYWKDEQTEEEYHQERHLIMDGLEA